MFPSHSPLIDAQTRFLTSLKFWTSSLLPALRGRAAVIDTLHLTNLSLENSSPGAGVSDCEVPVGQLLESALVLLQQWPNLPRHDYNCKALQIEAEQFPWIPFFAALLELCSRSRGQILMTNCKYVKPGLLCQNTPQGHQPESELEAIGLARLLLLLPALPDGDGSTQSIELEPLRRSIPTGNSEQLSSHSSQEFESHDGREPSTNSTAARRNTSRHEHSAAGAQCTRKFEGLGNEASTTTGSSDLSGNSEPGPGDCTSERQAEIETEYPPSSDSGTDSLDLGSASGVATPLPEYGTLYDSLPPAVVQQHIFPAPFYPCPLSPVICIADEDNICPLILSILSQRQVLHPGDTTPVIGIVYMAGIQLCQVVLGRVELTDSDQIQYQLATAMDPNAGVDSGVFRLQQALELHAFARFLLSTASEGTRLINVCTSGWDSEHDTARAWRADWAAIFMPDDHSQICNDRENEWQFDQWLHEATSPRSLYVSNSDYEGRSGRETPFLSHLNRGLDRLLGATISDPLDFEYPGIAEWSFDHLVLTIGFAPSSPNLNHHKLAFDSMSAMLFPYLDLSIKTCHVQASEPALSRWHVASLAPHACDALNEIDVQALSIVISKSFAEDCIHMTAPASHALWMKAVDWFSARWRCKASSRCLPSFNHWSSIKIHYARCVAYERHLDALEASQRLIESPEPRTSTKHPWPFTNLQFLCNRESMNHMLASSAIGGHDGLSEEHMPNTSRLDELGAAAKNASNMFFMVSDLKKGIKYNDHEDVHRHGHLVAQQMKHRLPQYPLWGDGYEMVSAAVNALFTDDQLLNVLDTAMITDIQNALRFTALRGDTDSTQEQDPEHAADALHLPILLINYQDYGITLEEPTRNHLRLSCVSAAYYLSFLGIADFPVYGLSICGPYGILSMAWYSSANECCYSLDRNTIHHRFDLTHEDGVRRYIAFLSKIEEHGRELLERFEAVKPALLERMKTEKGRASLRWTAQSQLEDHGLEPEQLAEEMPRDVMEALAEYTANTT